VGLSILTIDDRRSWGDLRDARIGSRGQQPPRLCADLQELPAWRGDARRHLAFHERDGPHLSAPPQTGLARERKSTGLPESI